MAGGVDVLYPAENAELGDDITDQGARISEQLMGLPPRARHFPARNRLISGLCRGVIIVEAAAKSGSLITARDALDPGPRGASSSRAPVRCPRCGLQYVAQGRRCLGPKY